MNLALRIEGLLKQHHCCTLCTCSLLRKKGVFRELCSHGKWNKTELNYLILGKEINGKDLHYTMYSLPLPSDVHVQNHSISTT